MLPLCLFFWGIWLYSNTWDAGYVWDDRAAIANNHDIRHSPAEVLKNVSSMSSENSTNSTTFQQVNTHHKNHFIPEDELHSFFKIFFHDFWGQDITMQYSHKSYRPLTTISYRINYLISGIHPHGFHIGNILIYGLCCVLYYQMISRWIDEETTIIASIFFCCHPIHVEAVASLVGRADSLCGVFYFLAILCYSDSLPLTLSTQLSHRVYGSLLSLLAFFFALLASFTKEIGLTVFGIFVILEYLFDYVHTSTSASVSAHIHPSSSSSSSSSSSGPIILSSQWFREWNTSLFIRNRKKESLSSIRALCWSYYQSLKSFLWRILPSPSTLSYPSIRVMSSVFLILSILYFRALLHGNYQLYPWTLMENHISLEPSFMTRALSYGHTHYLYALKLFNTITPHLCFDYGFPCLPTISSISSPLNLLTLGVYLLTASLFIYSLVSSRLILFLSLILILFPLLPALNILFPVGTILAERLCFIPSAGASLLIAELYTHEFRQFWTSQPTSSSSTSSTTTTSSSSHCSPDRISNPSALSKLFSIFFLLFPLSPLIGIMSYHVRKRNLDWKDEMSLFESSLAVCPDNIRALNNVAMLKSSEGKAVESAMYLERALNLYPFQLSTYINSGVTYARLGNYPKALYRLQQGLSLQQPGTSTTSTAGYLGLFHAQYYYTYLDSLSGSSSMTTATATPPLTSTSSSSSSHHLLGLLLTSHIYLNLSIIPWNTPSGYLTMANVEFELSHGTIRKGGSNPNPTPPPLVDIPPTSIEKNYLKAIELNQQLELLSQQGIPVQDTIDTSIAYNQLGLYYLTLYEQTQQQQQQQQQPYAALAYESFQTSLNYNSQRYESKLNLVILLNYLGYEHEAIQLLLEIYHNLLHIPHTDTDTDTDTALPTYSYSLYWTVGNTLEKFQQYNEAKECYEMILRVFKVSNDHPSYGMIEKNIERLVVLLADQAKRGGGAGGEKRQ